MPTSGTHITIVQRLALDPALSPLLGNPDPDPALLDTSSPKYDKDVAAGVIRMKYANLGAIGPDLFYALLDYDAPLQDMQNYLIKIGGSFSCVADLSEELNRYISGELGVITLGVTTTLQASSALLMGVLKDFVLAMAVKAGANFWPLFEPRRQQNSDPSDPVNHEDNPRTKWFWADYLHYVRSGQFAKWLLDETWGNLLGAPHNTQYQNLHAYALGYMTHYVVDVLGHPYVNQVVQSPWRTYWQRHHLVENFIDAYVWDRWHQPWPTPPAPPTILETPLDIVCPAPNALGQGAPITSARLHDLIAIGIPKAGDPVDHLVEKVCNAIKNGVFDAGIAEDTHPVEPADADFDALTDLLARALRHVYAEAGPNVIVHPLNLTDPGVVGARPRQGGYPEAEDIAAAYGTLRLALKLMTEDNIEEPVAPSIGTDIGADVQKLLDDLQHNLDKIPKIPAPPNPGRGGEISLEHLWKAIKDAARWAVAAAEAVAETVFDFVADVIRTYGDIVTDSIKYALYLLNKALYAAYRALRDVLMLAAYASPLQDDLARDVGAGFNTRSLWCSPGNLPPKLYPLEELTIVDGGPPFVPQREYFHRPLAGYPAYAPFIAPIALGSLYKSFLPSGALLVRVEQPAAGAAAPYPANSTPDAFIDGAYKRGADDMFAAGGPQSHIKTADPLAPNSYASALRDFGPAMANCAWAITHWHDAGFVPPDYNLDGDRGWAWPCWDVEGPKHLDPLHWQPDGVAHVNAGPAN